MFIEALPNVVDDTLRRSYHSFFKPAEAAQAAQCFTQRALRVAVVIGIPSDSQPLRSVLSSVLALDGQHPLLYEQFPHVASPRQVVADATQPRRDALREAFAYFLKIGGPAAIVARAKSPTQMSLHTISVLAKALQRTTKYAAETVASFRMEFGTALLDRFAALPPAQLRAVANTDVVDTCKLVKEILKGGEAAASAGAAQRTE
jgi:hypothetical protein